MATTATKTTPDPPPAPEMARSVAYAVLRQSSRKVLALIAAEAERSGGTVAISYDEISRHGIGRSVVGPAIRELCALGFIIVAVGAQKRSSFTLTDKWRAVATLKAARIISAAAREPRPTARVKHYGARPPPKPKKLDDVTRRELQNAKAHVDRNAASTRLRGHTWAAPRPVSLAPLAWPSRWPWDDTE